MSKYELQKQAFQASGVSYEESLIAQQKLQPSIYERLGTDGLKELSQRFYNLVFDDKEATWFLNIFSSSSKAKEPLGVPNKGWDPLGAKKYINDLK